YTNGVFYLNSSTQITGITDGTSNVYLLGESKYQVADLIGGTSEKRGLWSEGAYLANSWCYYTNLAAAVEPINQPAGLSGGLTDYTASSQRTSEAAVGRTFGSLHTGGCNMAFADGSVRFMPNSTDINVHRGLGTIADELPIG